MQHADNSTGSHSRKRKDEVGVIRNHELKMSQQPHAGRRKRSTTLGCLSPGRCNKRRFLLVPSSALLKVYSILGFPRKELMWTEVTFTIQDISKNFHSA